MRFKSEVSIRGIRPEMLVALVVADGAYSDVGADLVVTSVVDGVHSRTSLHYAGCAADLRTRNVENPEEIVAALRTRLPGDFDVVLEATHIHLEYQPKGAMP